MTTTRQLFILPPIRCFMRELNIEIDCHFVTEKLLSKDLITEFVNSNEQLTDIITKSLRRGPRVQFICSKLGAYDIYAPF